MAMPKEDLFNALDYIPSLKKMLIPSIGAIYYAPHNAYNVDRPPLGELISTENQASTLAGILMLRAILVEKNIFKNVVNDIESIAKQIQTFIKNSYDPSLGYFRQGGFYNVTTKTFQWDRIFAVDCQTWTMSVIGSQKVDMWFGKGTALKIWGTTKNLGGYQYNGTMAKGLGFGQSENIFSGEWTFGALNMLRLFTYDINDYNKVDINNEIRFIRDNIEQEITTVATLNNMRVDSVLYANKRYWIPFGWWANPIPSLASTGWAALFDSNYNPLFLGGQYREYQLIE
jgi:hypothetical protein